MQQNSRALLGRNGGWILVLGILVLAAAGLALMLQPGRQGAQAPIPAAETRSATLVPSPKVLEPFALTDHKGAPFTQESLAGQWSLLTFGYTYCPDVCPTILATLARFVHNLNTSGAEISPQIVFVSVDPGRDSPERLAQYVSYFNPEFVGVTGGEPMLRRMSAQLGVRYARAEAQDTALGYLMDHSASLMLTNPRGELHALFSPPHDASAMASDFRAIVAAARLEE